MIKRLICLVMTAILLFTTLQIRIFAEGNDSAYAYQLIKDFGIETLIDADAKTVSYREFYSDILRVANMVDVKNNDTVDYAEKLGIVYKTQVAGKFPNTGVKLNDALYAIIRILGYQFESEAYGGYPSGDMMVASKLGITDNIELNGEQTLDGKAVYQLFYNMLMATYRHNTTYNSNVAKYYTLLEWAHGIYKSSGRVEANEYSGLYSAGGAVDVENLKIDGILYNASCITDRQLIGYYVDFYYKFEDGENQIVSLSKKDNFNNEIVILAENVSDKTTLSKVVYHKDGSGKSYTADLERDIAVIKNGVALRSFTSADFKPQAGEIHLLRNKSGKYTVMHIWSYDTYWVKNFKLDDYTLTDYYGSEVDLEKVLKEKNVDVSDSFGNKKYVVDIKPDNVIWLASREDSDFVKIIISSESVTGTVQSVSQKSDEIKVLIDDKTFYVSEAYINKTHSKKTEIEMGLSGTFYLTPNNMIYGVKSEMDETILAAYLVNISADSFSLSAPQIKLYTMDGEMKIFDFASRVKVNNAMCDSNEVRTKLLDTENEFTASTDDVRRQLVLYKINKDGKINYIDSYYKQNQKEVESLNSLTLLYNFTTDGGDLFYRTSSKNFGGKVLYNASAKAIMVSPKTETASDNDFMPFSLTGFRDQERYNIEAYTTNRNSVVPQWYVCYPSGLSYDTWNYLVVDEIIESIDAEGYPVDKLTGYGIKSTAPTYMEYEISDAIDIDALDIEKGDLFYIKMDYKNRIVSAKKVYDADEEIFDSEIEKAGFALRENTYTTSDDWVNNRRVTVVTPLINDGGMIKYVHGINPEDTSLGDGVMNISTFKGITVYDPNQRKEHQLYVGSVEDIKSFDETETEYVRMIYASYYGDPVAVVVYKKEK